MARSVDFVKWSSQGMLRMSPDAMNALFKPTIDSIIEHLRKSQPGPGCSGAEPRTGTDFSGIPDHVCEVGLADGRVREHAHGPMLGTGSGPLLPRD